MLENTLDVIKGIAVSLQGTQVWLASHLKERVRFFLCVCPKIFGVRGRFVFGKACLLYVGSGAALEL